MTQFHAKVMYWQSSVMKLRTFLEYYTDGTSTVKFSYMYSRDCAAVFAQMRAKLVSMDLPGLVLRGIPSTEGKTASI